MSDRTQSRDLPDHVRLIVEEIENEIGDEEPGPVRPVPATNGRIEAAVRQILI